jgi:hypothetical protein
LVYGFLLLVELAAVGLPWFVNLSQVQYVAAWAPNILLCSGVVWVVLIIGGAFLWGTIVLLPHVPRLTAATLVGLFGLTVSDLPWKFSIQGFAQAPGLSIALCGFSLLGVLGYLSWEVSSCGVLGAGAIKRTGILLLIGLSQALLFSSIFSLLLAGPFYEPDVLDSSVIEALESSGKLALYRIQTWNGYFYPSLAALYGFGSLAAGTLLQVLWQERRITSPDVVPT